MLKLIRLSLRYSNINHAQLIVMTKRKKFCREEFYHSFIALGGVTIIDQQAKRCDVGKFCIDNPTYFLIKNNCSFVYCSPNSYILQISLDKFFNQSILHKNVKYLSCDKFSNKIPVVTTKSFKRLCQ